MSIKLPPPHSDALRLSDTLKERIIQHIHHEGSISLETFMQHALYEPGLGYYVNELQRFGEGGDFITAPEVNDLFGYCLARYALENTVCEFTRHDVIEFGAGTGKLASQLLLAWQEAHCLPARYLIIEVSPTLRQQQQALLKASIPDFYHKIAWLDALPEKWSGTLIANEVLDAMPAIALYFNEGVCLERRIGCDTHDELIWQLHTLPTSLAATLQQSTYFKQLLSAESYETEYNRYHSAWLNTLAHGLVQGQVILCDYGYEDHEFYHPQRSNGSLRCHYQHLAHDNLLLYPGLQDITTHVNFTRLFEAAETNKLSMTYFERQVNFLLDNGLTVWYENMGSKHPVQQKMISNDIQKLTDPQQMGDVFKILSLARG